MRRWRVVSWAAVLVVSQLALSGWQASVARRAGAATVASPRPWGRVVLPPGAPPFGTRHPDHAQRRFGPYSAELSDNWSGYSERNMTFSKVSGDWTVPSVVPAQAFESAATWIGIDGTSASTLIQTGTTSETANGQTAYFAWYELLPAPAVLLGRVDPADQMSASIQELAPGTWTISISDLTLGGTASGQVSYSTPGLSADWIEEAPTDGTTGQVVPLANYGSVQFTNVYDTGTNPGAYILDSWMIWAPGLGIISYPGQFIPADHTFLILYGSPGGVVPAPPPSSPVGSPVPSAPPSTPIGQTLPPPSAPSAPSPPAAPTPRACAPPVNQPSPGFAAAIAAYVDQAGCGGYRIVTVNGHVVTFDSPSYGDLSGSRPGPVIAVADTPDGAGYWLATSNGVVRAFGDAASYGDMSGQHLNGSVIAMAVTPDGKGYWLVGSDGGIFTFGDAAFFGSTGAMRLNQAIVGIAAAPGGTGYWLVAADGGVFTFGSAAYVGSTGGMRLNRPIVGITADPAGRGYRMVASDGGIFSFGAPFFGSLGGMSLSAPIVTMAPSTDGNGYYMLGLDGSVYTFGDAPFSGSL
jgi:hypothetical protein